MLRFYLFLLQTIKSIQGILEMAKPETNCFPVLLRSEEHTSELQSQSNVVCRLLHEKNLRLQAIDRRFDCSRAKNQNRNVKWQHEQRYEHVRRAQSQSQCRAD